MIDEADQALADWAGSVVKGVQVSFAPPAAADGEPAVSLFLAELSAAPPLRGPRRTPLQVGLRYLVSTSGSEPGAAHRLLGQLLFAAMEKEGFEVELGAPPAELWTALGVRPRPSFYLRVPLRVLRKEPETKLVQEPLVLQTGGIGPLSGVVLGPKQVPLAGARVEIPMAELATETDWKGRFSFPGVPLQPSKKLLLVRARGREQSLVIDQPAGEMPVLINFGPMED